MIHRLPMGNFASAAGVPRETRDITFSSGSTMEKLGILAVLEARPGKEQEVERFLTAALPMAEGERETVSWYALKLGPSTFGIFDTFVDQSGREAHLSGDIAKALFARAEELFAKPPSIDQPEILAAKAHRATGALGVNLEAR
jgi:quinol monooxygenase YgiN